jgi:hypothetical protein
MPFLRGANPAKRLWDAFLLREPERAALTLSPLQRETIARYHTAAMRRIRVAHNLQPSEPVAALSLYREAAVFLLTALAQSAQTEEIELPSSAAEAWRELDPSEIASPRRSPPPRLTQGRQLLASEDPIAVDELAPEALDSAARTAAETVAWLASLVEPRTQTEIRVTRGVRIAGVAFVFLFTLYEFVPLSRRNLALEMPAVASSQRAGSPPAGGVNNGDLEHTYGVCTNLESNPWVKIDLGASLPIREVRVYNRGDGYESEVLPLILQLSDDGVTYADVASRVEVFTRDRPWIAKLENMQGRFVRVYMPKEGYIALSEVEVY